MPLLPTSSSVPKTGNSKAHTPRVDRYREVAYHLDSQGRYVAQSYEVRPPSRSSPPAPPPRMQYLQSTEYSLVPESVARSGLSTSKTESGKLIIVVQSCEGLQDDEPGTESREVKPMKLAAPPSAPRPRRLSTPELSDIEGERPFCDCDRKIAVKHCVLCRCTL